MDGKRRRLERAVGDFDRYAADLDRLPLGRPPAGPDARLLVEEAKVGCMLGMLLCLSREQRVAYVLGEIFEAPSDVAAAVLGTTPAAFRKRLERARADLTNFMNDKCGLLNAGNPCRCDRKTAAFVAAGWVDPAALKFAAPHLDRVRAAAAAAAPAVDRFAAADYAALFRDHPLYPGPDLAAALADVLGSADVRRAFDLGEPP